MTPPPRTLADPGSPRAARVALVLAVALTAIAVGMQNIPPLIDLVGRFAGPPAATEPQPDADTAPAPTPSPTPSPTTVRPPDFTTPFDLSAKLYITLENWVKHDPSAMPTLDAWADSDADRLRAAIVAAELLGPVVAIERLDTLLSDLPGDSPLRRDAVVLRRTFAGEPPAEDSDDRARLIDHHGFYAEIALTFQLDDDHPIRRDLKRGGAVLAGVLLVAGTVGVLALLAGFCLLITGVILVATGKLRPAFQPPEPGGSVMLEVFCWFVGGFLVVSLGTDLLARALPTAAWVGMVPLFAQWLLLLAPLWPLLRGDSRADLARRLGWTGGRGLFKEIGFGFLGYLAGLPVFLVAVIITAILIAVTDRLASGQAGPPPSPVIDLVAGGSPFGLVMLFLLATVWAPLCEELVFRGALQRHLRARLAGPLAVLASATVFGFMHGYGPLLVLPLIALGCVFGLMREFRGSLVAAITAHALHNATVLTLVISIVQLVQ